MLYHAERRETPRKTEGTKGRVLLEAQDGSEWAGTIKDRSYQGLAVSVNGQAPKIGSRFRIRFQGGESDGELAFGCLRNAAPSHGQTRLGMELSGVPFAPLPTVQARTQILNGSRASANLRFATAAAKALPRRLFSPRLSSEEVPVVEFTNDKGQFLRGILDRTSDAPGGTAVVIPPAWGRTKETLLPLADTLLATFLRAGENLSVLRFDGTYRRGESFVPPDCREPGHEATRFTFSQGVRDISAALDFLDGEPTVRPEKVILVTFSLASIDGRRAVLLNQDRLAGWVCVVGMADLQSGLRAVSGGIDYGYGLLRGVKFGVHRLGGVLVNMDVAGDDGPRQSTGLPGGRASGHVAHCGPHYMDPREARWLDGHRASPPLRCPAGMLNIGRSLRCRRATSYEAPSKQWTRSSSSRQRWAEWRWGATLRHPYRIWQHLRGGTG